VDIAVCAAKMVHNDIAFSCFSSNINDYRVRLSISAYWSSTFLFQSSLRYSLHHLFVVVIIVIYWLVSMF